MGKIKAFIDQAYDHALEMGFDYDEADRYVKDSIENLLASQLEDSDEVIEQSFKEMKKCS